jgi:hypothetical protein
MLMFLDLRLRELPAPRISTIRLDGSTRALREIASRNRARADGGGESRAFRNRKEEVRRHLMSRGSAAIFEEARKPGAERVLISLYVEHAAQADAKWLPAFDEAVAQTVLGLDGRAWHAGRRRQATQLFFTQFDRLPALPQLCERLVESYRRADLGAAGPGEIWRAHHAMLFRTDGPQKIATAAKGSEMLSQLSERFAVPDTGRFAARLKELLLLTKLQATEIGKGAELLQELEAIRDSPFENGVLMGSAALRMMTRKVLASGGEWKGDWPDWILRLGCDPALPATSAVFGKWWGSWHPTAAELSCAQRALNRQTLEYFIQFLEQSLVEIGKHDQFESRAGFLRRLDDTRRILRFKLILHPTVFQNLPRAYREQRHRIAKLEGGQGTSVIAMECSDDVWLVEGTHIFALRAFRRDFPAPEIFRENRSSYPYYTFTQEGMHKDRCPIWKAHMCDWLPSFLARMNYRFQVEWNDLLP